MAKLNRLLGRLGRTTPSFDAALAPERAFVAIGDIHGRQDLLTELLGRLSNEAPGLPLVFLGDYIDRGPNSAGALQTLFELERNSAFETICLMGNHEAMMLEFLDAPETTWRLWHRNGGAQTAQSFGLNPANAAPEQLCRALKDRAGAPLLDWIAQRPLIWQSGNVIVSHAGGDPTRPIDPRRGHGFVWGHPQLFKTPRADGLWMVHGHYIVDTPTAKAGRIAIDTGAFRTGRLTAAIIEPGQVRFIST